MDIQKTSASATISIDPKNLPRNLSQLQPGSSLNAVVMEKLAENSFILKLSDGLLLRAQSPNPLELGQILKLEVVKAGDVPELKIVVPQQAVQPEQTVIQQTLRQLLPKQQSLVDFAAALQEFAKLPGGKPEAVSAAVDQLLDTIASKDELMSAERLQKSINNSGAFLEAKLANLLPPQGDLKGHLLTLADALRKTPSTSEQTADAAKSLINALAETKDPESLLLAKTEGAIARIVLDQLGSLPQNNETQSSWHIEIPFTDRNHSNSVKLTINRDSQSSQEAKQSNWSVMLEINPPGMGALQCKISLIDDKIDTYFWSDQQNTTTLVKEHLGLLAASYQEAGLAVGQLNALDGSAMKTPAPETSSLPTLLDEYI